MENGPFKEALLGKLLLGCVFCFGAGHLRQMNQQAGTPDLLSLRIVRVSLDNHNVRTPGFRGHITSFSAPLRLPDHVTLLISIGLASQ